MDDADTDDDALLDRSSLPFAAGAGLGAWLLGYLFTYLLTAGDIRTAFPTRIIEAFTGDPATWQIVGWVFYNAHLVSTTVDLGIVTVTQSFVGGDGFTPLLYVVPPLVLFAGGIAVVRATGITDSTEAALAGVVSVVGYLPLAVAGALLFRIRGSGPTIVPAVLIAGIIYPVLFGALGALFASMVGGSEPDDRRKTDDARE